MTTNSVYLIKCATTNEFIALTATISETLKEADKQNKIVSVKDENGLTSIEIRTRYLSDRLYDHPVERKSQLEKTLFAYAAENYEFISTLSDRDLEVLSQLPGMDNAASIPTLINELFEERKNLLKEIKFSRETVEQQKAKIQLQGALLKSLENVQQLELEIQAQIEKNFAQPPEAIPMPAPLTGATAILMEMRTNLDFADITLKGSDGEVKAHRAVLENIPLFADPKLTEIDLSQIKKITLNHFLDFHYGIDLFQLNIDELFSLNHLARDLHCQELISHTFELLWGKIDKTDVNDPLKALFSIFINEQVLPEHIDKFIERIAKSSIRAATAKYVLARMLFDIPPEKTQPQTMYLLGLCYRRGIGVAQDMDKALKCFHSAMSQGFAKAQSGKLYFELANSYSDAIACEPGEFQKWNEVYRLYHLAADRGFEASKMFGYCEYRIALCYWNGDGVKKDIKESFRIYHLAADHGCIQAQLHLGKYYEEMSSAERVQDLLEASRLYRLADQTQAGKDGLKRIGQRYLELANGHRCGAEIQRHRAGILDWNEAYRLYRLAADHGVRDGSLAHCEFRIADCYWHGRGVERNDKEALRFYHLAANHGNEEALLELAQRYTEGRLGVEKNLQEAFGLYLLAADQSQYGRDRLEQFLKYHNRNKDLI